jgi:hypothetical protein
MSSESNNREPLSTTRRVTRLYEANGTPSANFNVAIKEWLDCTRTVRGHQPPAAFEGVRKAYCAAVEAAQQSGLDQRNANRLALSNMTTMLLGHDLSAELQARLSSTPFNPGGFRNTLAQGVAKNIGENFVNTIVFALANLLASQDQVLVDKGLPPKLRTALTLRRKVPLKTGDKEIHIPIEGDAAIFSRNDPLDAIVISAKTRLKEVFHIGTMWKLLFDMLGDDYCKEKWGLEQEGDDDLSKVRYVFATADMVAKGGATTQGGDVERTTPRNLIAMDASFFDYVFVSKSGIAHVENKITLGTRGALFHELGCLIDLIEQKFGITLG